MQDNLKVMIVDDEPINLEILDEMLSDRCETQLVESGEAALANLDNFHPDLILLDVMMQGIDGYETCRKVRAHPKESATKIIMISAKASESDIKLGLEAGADEYIAKPFDEDSLIEAINRYL